MAASTDIAVTSLQAAQLKRTLGVRLHFGCRHFVCSQQCREVFTKSNYILITGSSEEDHEIPERDNKSWAYLQTPEKLRLCRIF